MLLGSLAPASTEAPPDLQLVDCGAADVFAHRRLRSCHGQKRGGGFEMECCDGAVGSDGCWRLGAVPHGRGDRRCGEAQMAASLNVAVKTVCFCNCGLKRVGIGVQLKRLCSLLISLTLNNYFLDLIGSFFRLGRTK